MQAVLIPCRTFDVEVVLGPHDGLSLIEQTVVRAVALGVARVDQIASTLAIPGRMVLEVAIDLLARGLVDAEPDGTLHVHERVLIAMADPERPEKDWFVSFQSAQLPEPSTVRLAQDLVSGEVFSVPRIPPLERQRLPLMPENNTVPTPDELPAGVLLAAVTQAMRARRARDAGSSELHGDPLPRDARILNVRVRRTQGAAGSAGHVGSQRLLLHGVVNASRRGEDEPPRVRILEPVDIPVLVRHRISSALDDLWARGFGRGSGQFFQRIELAEPSTEAGASAIPALPISVIDRMAALLETNAAEPGTVHAELTVLEGEARPAVELLAAYSAEPKLCSATAARFQDAVLLALGSANRQVVLACPWIGQLGHPGDLQDAFRSALERGVNIVLVWGINTDPAPIDASWEFLRRLAEDTRPASGCLIFAGRGAGSHAKVIVCDLDWAVVSSCNFLNASRDRSSTEVGVELRSSPKGVVPLGLQAILAWIRRMIPDYRVQERCLDDPMLFGRSEQRGSLLLDVQPVASPNIVFGAAGVATWRRAWESRTNYVRELAATAYGAAVPIYDGEHRELLVQAISTARRRLHVGSHRVTTRGLSEPLVEAVERALARGVEVRIRHGAIDLEPVARARLDQLAGCGVSVEAWDTHAKIIVCDDWAVVSSFNFLSVEPGTRSAHELGVQLHEPPMVDALWNNGSDNPPPF